MPPLNSPTSPGGRARAFRKNDQDISGIGEQFPANRQALANVRLRANGKRVHDTAATQGRGTLLKK